MNRITLVLIAFCTLVGGIVGHATSSHWLGAAIGCAIALGLVLIASLRD